MIPEKVIDAILVSLSDRDENVRLAAIQSVTLIGSRAVAKARERLSSLITDPAQLKTRSAVGWKSHAAR
jgi:hypothetical protein